MRQKFKYILFSIIFLQCVGKGVKGQYWEQLNPLPPLYAVGDFHIFNDSSLILFGSFPYEIYKTTNSGNDWITYNLNNPATYNHFFVDSLNGYAINSESYRTTNGGITWDSIGTSFALNRTKIWFTSIDTGYALGANGDIQKTVNGAQSWVSLNSTTTKSLLDLHFINPLVGIVIGSDGLVIRTEDAGNTWNQINIGTTTSLGSVNFINDSIGYISISSGDTIYKTTNSGVLWQVIKTGVLLWKPIFIDTLIGYGISGKQILKTINGGTLWSVIYTDSLNFLANIKFINESIGYVLGGNSRIIKTNDGGNTWSSISKGTSINFRSIDYKDSSNIYIVGGQDASFFKSSNAGQDWTLRKITSNWFFMPLFTQFSSAQTGYTCGSNSNGSILYKTNNGGVTWDSIYSNYQNAFRYVEFLNNDTGILSGNGIILRTTNGGINWLDVTGTNNTTNWRQIQMVNNCTGYIISNTDKILKTTDGGLSWSQLNLTPFNLRAVFFVNDTLGFISGISGKLMKTIDGGVNWIDISYQTYFSYYKIQFLNSEIGYLWATSGSFENKILKTINGGNTWFEIFNNDFDLYDFDFLNSNDGIVIGRGGLILKTTTGGCGAPVINQQPINQGICPNENTMLKVAATGVGSLQYQWYKNGQVISGLNDTLLFQNASPSDSGIYYCKIFNSCGYTISNIVLLTVMQEKFTTINYNICIGDSVFANNTYQHNDGVFIDTLQTWYGCDSIVTTNVTVFTTLPIISAGLSDSICAGENFTLSNSSANYFSEIRWVSTGTGTFSDTTVLHPIYYPSANDIQNGYVWIKFAVLSISPCTQIFHDSLLLTIIQRPTSFAGNDTVICENNNFQISQSAALNYSSLNWSSNGDGNFSNNSVLNPIYIPSLNDIQNGGVWLKLKAFANIPCNDIATDSLYLQIQLLPFSDAGNNISICENDNYNLTGIIATNFSTLHWTSNGAGILSNENTLSPTYSPSLQDLVTGTVVLKLTAYSENPCQQFATDSVILTIIPTPFADAGNNGSICEGDDFNISGSSASNNTSLNWTTTGNGTFIGIDTLFPTYTPSIDDINNGSVKLILSANPITPCSTVSKDTIILSITKQPFISLIELDTICSSGNYNIIASGNYFSALNWTTSGNGLFSNDSLNSIYFPSSQEIQNGNVWLSITANSISPCLMNSNDSLLLFIVPLPFADAGISDTICESSNLEIITSNAGNYSEIIWLTNGTGSFSNIHLLHPIYTPSIQDINTGLIKLILQSHGILPCIETAIDTVMLYINKAPNISVLSQNVICEGSNYSITGSSISNISSILWSSTGTGSFSNINLLNPTYFPSNNDIDAEQTNLILSVNGNYPCLSTSDTLNLVIHPKPYPDFHSQHQCHEETTIFIDSTKIQSGLVNNYKWNLGDGTNIQNSSPTAISHFYASPNTYNVKLITTSNYGCKDSIQKNIEIYNKPIAGFIAANVCDGKSVIFINNSQFINSAALNYYWLFGDGNSSTVINPTHIYSNSGAFHPVLYINSVEQCKDTIQHNLTIYPQTNANFEYDSLLVIGDTAFFRNASLNESIYNWSFGDGKTSTIRNSSNYYLNVSGYDIRLIVNNTDNCPDTITKKIRIRSKYPSEYDLVLYPNPTTGEFSLNLKLDAESDVLIEIYDAIGSKIKDLHYKNSLSGLNRFIIDLSDKSNGIYTLTVSINGTMINRNNFDNGVLKDKNLKYKLFGKVIKFQ